MLRCACCLALCHCAAALAAKDPLYRLPIAEPLAASEAVYVCTHLHAEASVPAILALGTAGPAKVWLNGVEVARESRTRPKLAPDTARVYTRLDAGASFLLVKLCGPGDAAFHAKIMGVDGKAIADLAPRQPFDVDAPSEGLTWAYIGPFACHPEACVLDTRFPPEQHPAGPPKDAASTCRWALSANARTEPSSALLNPGFEFVDAEGRPYAWYAWWGAAETAESAAEGKRSLRLPRTRRASTREIKSHPFVVDPRKPARLCFDYRILRAGASDRGVVLSCWVQWLDNGLRVVGAAHICAIKPADVKATVWERRQSESLDLPFAAAFARVQFKSWKSQSEVLIDRIVFENPPPSQ